jgi:uncharacterized protein (DUF1919 family)
MKKGNFITLARNAVGQRVSRLLLPEKFTVLSRDCWGGQIYRQAGIVYQSPTVGLWMAPEDFNRFCVNINKPDACDINEVKSDRTYPIGQTPYARLHFLHYESFHSAKASFIRRISRIEPNYMRYATSFGEKTCAPDAIDAWNAAALQSGIAFTSEYTRKIWTKAIHGEIFVPNYQVNAVILFEESKRLFDYHTWVKSGRIENGIVHRLNHFLFWDRSLYSRLKNVIRRTSNHR